ncbi:hypothetical protein ACEPAH_9062 [Sanghuangporus vaninii]
MRSLSLPIPVALFIRRLFNVFSSITISNQYLLARKSEVISSGVDERSSGDASRSTGVGAVGSEVMTTRQNSAMLGDSNERAHWDRLKPWPWSIAKKRAMPRQTHSASVEEVKHRESFDEKSLPPSDPLPSRRDPTPSPRTNPNLPLSPIYTLMNNPTLFNPVRIPRNPIVLCHGLYGYDVRGPSNFPMLQLHYWANVLKVLKKKFGVEVIVTGVPGTGSIESRAKRLDEYLRDKAPGRDINLMAHSMGGLDCRHLITHVKPKGYNPVSLTTICTPHRGSPFMDWCKETIGLGRLQRKANEAASKTTESSESSSLFSLANVARLPSSLTTFLLSVVDSPAYANLTTHYLQNVFNPATPDDPRVRYYSIAARTDSMSVIHPLWLPKTILDGYEAREREADPYPDEVDWGNDGLVTVRSAKWGEFLGTMEGCDHWDVRGGGGLGADNEWHVDLTLPSALKNSLSDPLSLVNNINWREWTRYVAAWRKEEAEREKASGKEIQRIHTETRGSKSSGLDISKSSPSSSDTEDAVLKSSTDKFSAVFDWVSDQVATSKKPSSSTKTPSLSDVQSSSETSAAIRKSEKERVDAKKAKETADERTKFDLERFYVALCRKLYDDGL